MEAADELQQVVLRLCNVVAGDVDLDPVAGGEHHRLARRRPQRELSQRAVEASAGLIQTLAELDGSGPMIDAEQQQVHVS